MSTVLKVEGMSCNHCKTSVETALLETTGVTAVEVDLGKKEVTISHSDDLTVAKLAEVIEEQGYDVVR
ncbi:MAG: cation transporter [Bacilli bacterium]